MQLEDRKPPVPRRSSLGGRRNSATKLCALALVLQAASTAAFIPGAAGGSAHVRNGDGQQATQPLRRRSCPDVLSSSSTSPTKQPATATIPMPTEDERGGGRGRGRRASTPRFNAMDTRAHGDVGVAAMALVAAVALGDAATHLAEHAPLVQASMHAVSEKVAAAAAANHFSVRESLLAGTGAGLTRAVSRILTFPLDTVKTRVQVSRLSEAQLERMPPGMRAIVSNPSSGKGLFSGFGPFLLQAGPSNAAFFLTFDAVNVLGAALAPGLDHNLTHLLASCLATIPSNLIRIPSEVIKQRLQVGQVQGNALDAVREIVRTEGVGGLFVGGGSQLSREIPFNAIQFVIYDALKVSHLLGGASSPEEQRLVTDALLGAAAAGAASLGTQPMDTTKTRIQTQTVPDGKGGSGSGDGVVRSAISVAKAEGLGSLYLGSLPRLMLVSTGGAFYFLGQELVRALVP